MYNCYNCEKELSDIDVRWACDQPYCEDCFFESYNYCSHRDSVIHRDEARYDSDGDCYCDDCYDEGYDDDAPNNPDVYDSDRELISVYPEAGFREKLKTEGQYLSTRKMFCLRQLKIKSD